jgi:peptide chain release factor 2
MDNPKARLVEIEAEMARADFWTNKDRAQELVREHTDLKAEIAGQGKYDKNHAILTILAGAGGDDAEDFAQMLLEMYRKYAERQGWGLQIIHQNENDHGGYRNLTVRIEGDRAYGILKNESGVHRLVRLSPFNAKSLRHTSFALVEIVPELPTVRELAIPEQELEFEFSKSSGPGGQNVNKRETAVRVIHKPTNLSATGESERSQAQNKEQALKILAGKLYRFRERERQAATEGMYISKTAEVEWGNQIRSYVLHPYKLVKDHRTGVETSDVGAVLAGELEEFIEAEKDLS